MRKTHITPYTGRYIRSTIDIGGGIEETWIHCRCVVCDLLTIHPISSIEGTEPFCDIEAAFDICIDEDDALELYDMDLDEATRKIMEIREQQCEQITAPDRQQLGGF